jgi:hypothetical protein
MHVLCNRLHVQGRPALINASWILYGQNCPLTIFVDINLRAVELFFPESELEPIEQKSIGLTLSDASVDIRLDFGEHGYHQGKIKAVLDKKKCSIRGWVAESLNVDPPDVGQ